MTLEEYLKEKQPNILKEYNQSLVQNEKELKDLVDIINSGKCYKKRRNYGGMTWITKYHSPVMEKGKLYCTEDDIIVNINKFDVSVTFESTSSNSVLDASEWEDLKEEYESYVVKFEEVKKQLEDFVDGK